MPPKKKKRKPRSRARGTAAAPAARTESAPLSQEKRRERLEARREAKAQAYAKKRRQQQRARMIRLVVLVGSLSAIVWFLFIRNSIPNAIAGHDLENFDTFVSESSSGTLHTADPVTNYESSPPVSGRHSATPAGCGVYGAPIANENMVHSLEHGAVGILYAPDAPIERIREVEKLVESYDSHVFSAPFQRLEDPFTLVAWAHLMRLDSYDATAIKEFIEVFREGGDAPEEQDCDMGSDDSFEPDPTASPSGSPTEDAANETPAPDDSGGDKKKKKG